MRGARLREPAQPRIQGRSFPAILPQPPPPRLRTNEEAEAMLPRRVSQAAIVCTTRNQSRTVSSPRAGRRERRGEQAMSVRRMQHACHFRSRRQERLVHETCARRVDCQDIDKQDMPFFWLHDTGQFWNRVAEAKALRSACDGRRGLLHHQAVSGATGWRWRVFEAAQFWTAGRSQASMRRSSGAGARRS